MSFEKLHIVAISLSIVSFPACLKRTTEPTVTKNIQHMNLEEAQFASAYYKKTGHLDLSAKALERIITLSTDHETSADALIRLADTHLELNKYEEAQKNYKEFQTLYPGNKLHTYAAYKEIIAHQKEIRPAYHDQAKTRQTIELCERFLEEFQDDEHAQEIIGIKDAGYKLLIEHEVIIIQFYITKYHLEHNVKSLISAIKRLENLKKNIIVHIFDKKSYETVTTLINLLLDTYDPQNTTAQIHTLVELAEKILEKLFDEIYGGSSLSSFFIHRF